VTTLIFMRVLEQKYQSPETWKEALFDTLLSRGVLFPLKAVKFNTIIHIIDGGPSCVNAIKKVTVVRSHSAVVSSYCVALTFIFEQHEWLH
jgi:hypothetical protein